MYTGKVILTNPRRTPFSLSNAFNDAFKLQDGIEACQSAAEACNVANNLCFTSDYWSIDNDTKSYTRLKSTDYCGNISYLLIYKKDATSCGLKGFSDAELMQELINRGYAVCKKS